MRANDLFDAFEALDTEMVYEAHAVSVTRRNFSRRTLVAAAIVLLLIGFAVIYGVFLAPVSAVYLDSRESAVITLNSRERVLSAGDDPALSGGSAQEAVAASVREMIDSGALSEEENTLILGMYRLSEKTQEQLLKTVQNVFTESRFHGAIICLPCSESGGKAAVVDLLMQLDDSLDLNDLSRLGANDLNLLLHRYEPDGVQLLGEPNKRADTAKPAKKKPSDIPAEPETQIVGSPAANGSEQMQTGISSVPQPTASASAVSEQPQPTPADPPTIAPTEKPTAQKQTAPTESQTASPTAKPTAQPTEGSTESDRPTHLIADIPYVEIICSANTFGKKIAYEQLSHTDKTTNLDGYTEQNKSRLITQDNRLTIIRSWRDLSYLEAVAYDEGNDALADYLEEVEKLISPDHLFFRDYALVIGVCYFDDYRYNVDLDIESIQINGNTAYVWVQSTYPSNLISDTIPLLHTNYVAAKVGKNDLEDIDTLKLVFTKQ